MVNNGTKHDGYDPSLEIKELKTTVDKIDRPDKFAVLFCEAAQTQVAIKNRLGEVVKEIIADDKSVKEKIKELLKEIQRDNIRFMLSGVTWVLTSAISAAIGSIVTYIVTKVQ